MKFYKRQDSDEKARELGSSYEPVAFTQEVVSPSGEITMTLYRVEGGRDLPPEHQGKLVESFVPKQAKPRKRGRPPLKPEAEGVPPISYLYRDPEKRRAYMRAYMAKRRGKS